MRSTRKLSRLAAFGVALALGLTACAGGDDDTAAESPATSEDMTEEMTEDMDDDMTEEEMTEEAMALPTGQFGPGCDAIPAEGEGSSEGMADDQAATAASNNPALSTLVSLVGEAGLVDTINNAEALTIFAPANSAFEALDEDTLEAVQNDPDLLATVLTYHVVAGEQLDAQALADAGTVTPLAEVGDLTVSADGETVMVEAAGSTATVVCGNVATANATVHIIDTVLLPPAGEDTED